MNLLRSMLFKLEPEKAHRLGIEALKSGVMPGPGPEVDPRLVMNVIGLRFPNPLGMAAGFDKDAEVPMALMKLGFGFSECGTITPRPQSGNPQPRVFRLVDHEAVINRLGFNNGGLEAALIRIMAMPERGRRQGILGINVGANKDADDRIADYAAGIHQLGPYADYITANISSPNTPGLRDLQAAESLKRLVEAVVSARDSVAQKRGAHLPVLIKIAPDMSDEGLSDVAGVINDSPVEGVIVSNTTLDRSLVSGRHADEAGGLSGKPLFHRSTVMLARMRQRLDAGKIIIGVGGVHDGATALAKIEAGASLVQLYTSFIYGGPALPSRITQQLAHLLDERGVGSLQELVGTKVDKWAESDPDQAGV